MSVHPVISVVIPVLRDPVELRARLEELSILPHVESLVVDAGERDDVTDELVERFPQVRWLSGPVGRGAQMNVGARAARGRWIVFLHADTELAAGWTRAVSSLEHETNVAGGSFRLALRSTAWQARAIEWGVAWRVRLFDLPYGDQAIFVRRNVFWSLGGYREMALMEDVDLVRRLRKAGYDMRALPLTATSSARRWERDGWWYRSCVNVALVSLFTLGVAPRRLAPIYYSGVRVSWRTRPPREYLTPSSRFRSMASTQEPVEPLRR
ncbi:MAG: TIGR04283 family arsenosugar biosynthesis glycosyltransferase [Vicinamibacterales bacterium]